MSYFDNLDVSIQDQHTQVIDLYLTLDIQTLTLIGDVTLNDASGTVSSAVQPTVGNYVCVKEAGRVYQGEILTSVANGINWDITVDSPSDFAFTVAGASVVECDKNLKIDGSVSTKTYTIAPPTGVSWDVTRVIFIFNTTSAPKDDFFGDSNVGALTNGVVLRKKDGETFNIFNVKTFGDLAGRCYDLQLLDKSAGYGAIARRTFGGASKNGVTVRLDAITGDEFQCLVRDDLTAFVDFNIIVQGHVVD